MAKNLTEMTRKELYKLACKAMIDRRSRLSKEELIADLRKQKRRKPKTAKPPKPRRAAAFRAPAPKPMKRRKRTRKLTPRVRATSKIAAPPAQAAPPPPTAQPRYVDRGPDLPAHYGRDIVVALVRDPNCVFVYWELAGPRTAEVRVQYGERVFREARWTLRLRNVTAGTQEELAVQPEVGNWYLAVPDDSEIEIEIGFRSPAGEFVCLAKSNRVSTPPAGVSSLTDEKWMIVEEEFRKLLAMAQLGAARSSPGAFVHRLAVAADLRGVSSRSFISRRSSDR
ncbi:MAG: DUF4912 domain-containing protein [Planctomycetota bacterium]